jgi:hypothetical protein
MPEPLILSISGLCLLAGAMVILFPNAVVRLNGALNRHIIVDPVLVRYRHVLGVLLFVVSYGVFRLALLLLPYRGAN